MNTERRLQYSIAVLGILGVLWTVSEFISATRHQPRAMANDIEELRDDIQYVGGKYEKLEERYNRHIESAWRDYEMRNERYDHRRPEYSNEPYPAPPPPAHRPDNDWRGRYPHDNGRRRP